jgi:DNA repair protein RadC
MSNIKSLPSFEQPREKFIRKGSVSLSDAELLALIICSGNRELSALELSEWLLSKYNYSLKELARCTYPELMKIRGIGEAKALSIVAAFELGRRKSTSIGNQKIKIKCSEDAYNLVRAGMEDLNYEVFKVILLNRSHTVIKVVEMSRGGVAGTIVDPKLIFKTALDHLATSIILVHNHPSGNLDPSDADKQLTRQLTEAGELLNVKVLDHLIVSYTGFYSFADIGFL